MNKVNSRQFEEPRIGIVGVGTSGIKVFSELDKITSQKITTIGVGFNQEIIKSSLARVNIHLETGNSENNFAKVLTEAIRELNVLLIVGRVGEDEVYFTISEIAKTINQLDILSVVIITKASEEMSYGAENHLAPFEQKIRKMADSLLLIDEGKASFLVSEKPGLSMDDSLASWLLCAAIKGITDITTHNCLMGRELKNLRKVLYAKNIASIAFTSAVGANSPKTIVKKAIASPLLEIPQNQIKNALITIRQKNPLPPSARKALQIEVLMAIPNPKGIIYGYIIDENMEDDIQVTLIGTN